MQGEIQRLSVAGQIEPIITLERLYASHSPDEGIYIGGRPRLFVVVVERAHGHLPGIVGKPKGFDMARLGAGSALILKAGDAHLVEVAHQSTDILDRLLARHIAEL